MSDAFKQLSDAIANAVQQTSESLLSVDGRRRMPATGIVWAEDIVVTAHHVVERDENLRVMTSDGTSYDATLIGRDPSNDVAVLKVEGAGLKPAQWANDGSLQVGNLVVAVGRPTEQVQATLGVVSALVNSGAWHRGGQRKRHHGGGRGRRMGRILAGGYVQTDVTMYPGFSGGALISGDGLVHGLNTSGFGRGASIAVPVASIRKSIAVLMAHGRMRQGYLGVGIQPARLTDVVTQELEQEIGLLVVSVEANSPAQGAGIIVGDILTAIDGDSLTQADDIMMLLSGDRIGEEIEIQLARGGIVQTLNATVGERE